MCSLPAGDQCARLCFVVSSSRHVYWGHASPSRRSAAAWNGVDGWGRTRAWTRRPDGQTAACSRRDSSLSTPPHLLHGRVVPLQDGQVEGVRHSSRWTVLLCVCEGVGAAGGPMFAKVKSRSRALAPPLVHSRTPLFLPSSAPPLSLPLPSHHGHLRRPPPRLRRHAARLGRQESAAGGQGKKRHTLALARPFFFSCSSQTARMLSTFSLRPRPCPPLSSLPIGRERGQQRRHRHRLRRVDRGRHPGDRHPGRGPGRAGR